MTSKNISTTDQVEVVENNVGPLLADEDRALIERIASGEAVDSVDVSNLDHVVMVGLHDSLATADGALTDVAGFLGAALKLKTWKRVARADGAPYVSELDFVETQINAHPVVAQILKGTAARQAVVAAVGEITDSKGKPVGLRRMAELLGVSKSQVANDKAAAEGTTAEGTTADRGPQDGGEVAPNATAAKRFVTALATNATKVRDAEQVMTAEQLIAVASEGRDLVKTAIATLRLRFPEAEVPEWADFLAAPAGPGRLRSGAEGTVASGPVLAGAPADPTGVAAPAPVAKPKPKARAAS